MQLKVRTLKNSPPRYARQNQTFFKIFLYTSNLLPTLMLYVLIHYIAVIDLLFVGKCPLGRLSLSLRRLHQACQANLAVRTHPMANSTRAVKRQTVLSFPSSLIKQLGLCQEEVNSVCPSSIWLRGTYNDSSAIVSREVASKLASRST